MFCADLTCVRFGCRGRRLAGFTTCHLHRMLDGVSPVTIPERVDSVASTEIITPVTAAVTQENEVSSSLHVHDDELLDDFYDCQSPSPIAKRRKLDIIVPSPAKELAPLGPAPVQQVEQAVERKYSEEDLAQSFRWYLDQLDNPAAGIASIKRLTNQLEQAHHIPIQRTPPRWSSEPKPKRSRAASSSSDPAPPARDPSAKFRHWAVTIQNPSSDTVDNLQDPAYLSDLGIDVCAGQVEVAPTTGTPHLQLYIQTKVATRFDAMKKYAVFNKTHWEPRKGTHEQMLAYVCKDDSRHPDFAPFVCFAPNRGWEQIHRRDGCGQGQRSDLAAAALLAQSGATLKDLHEAGLSHVAIRYHAGYNALRRSHLSSGIRRLPEHGGVPTTTVVYIGSPGAGKTRALRQLYDDIAQAKVWSPAIGHDVIDLRGYEAQTVMHFDEHLPSIDNLKVICDDGPATARVLYGEVPIIAERIYISINRGLLSWFKNAQSVDLEAVARRIDLMQVWTGRWPNAKKFSLRLRELYMNGVHVLHLLYAVSKNRFVLHSQTQNIDMSYYTGSTAPCLSHAFYYVPANSSSIDVLRE